MLAREQSLPPAAMDDLFKWAKDSPLAIITYFGLWFWTFEAVKAWVGSPPSWLTIIWVFVGVSLVAALGTLVIGWALRLGWRILQIAWRVVRPQRHSRMRQELQILSAKRRQETLAFAKSMIAGIEAKQLGLGEIGVLAELLSRPGRPVSGQGR
jgi:hypothetical protein